MEAGATVTFEDIADAARHLDGLVDHTPAARSRILSAISGADVVVKFENLQFTGSFKDRGAANRLLALTPAQRRAGVVAVSAGNHAQGVAYHATRLGIPVTVLMPTTAPLAKVANTVRLGATVIQHGITVTEAMERLGELEGAGLTLVHPYDDPLVIAGQGTVGLELLDEYPDLEALVVPVGGGGLIAGICVAAERLAPHCEIVGVQSERFPFAALALGGADPPITPPEGPATGTRAGTSVSIADGIAVKRPGALPLAILAAHGIEVTTVPEHRIEEAIGLLAEVEKTVAEGAGAAGLAALLHRPERFTGRRVGIVLTGGNIDPRLLSSVLLRSLVRQGRLTRMRVETDDLPGQLAAIAAVVGASGGNLIEVTHQRLLSAVPLRRVDVDLLVETRDAAHLDRIRAALAEGGHEVTLIEP